MLSRTADNLYWLARYVERAEYLARILEATQRLSAVPTSEGLTTNEWESAVATAGCAAGFFSAHKDANEQIEGMTVPEADEGEACFHFK